MGLVLVLAAVVVANFVTLPYDAIVPGQAQDVGRVITLPAERSHPVHGQIDLTDVGVALNIKLINLLPDWLDSNVQLVKQNDLTYGLPVSEFDAQGALDMQESQLTAGAVALRQLGYSVPEHDVGVAVYVVDPDVPAFKVLHVGDVITAVGGTPTPDTASLVAALHSHQPGDAVTLEIGTVADPTKVHPVTVTLSHIVNKGVTQAFLGVGDPSVPFAGFGTQPAYDMPFPVGIKTDNIGGPSAGLAFTLGIVNTLSGGELTGGKQIAATGTIRPDGTVGDVGGVAQKTVAVERAGAKVFLVPTVEVATARAHASSGLQVIGVSNLGDALSALRQLGGTLGPASAGPPAGPGGSSVPSDWQNSPWS